MNLTDLKGYVENAEVFDINDRTTRMLWLIAGGLALLVEATDKQTELVAAEWKRLHKDNARNAAYANQMPTNHYNNVYGKDCLGRMFVGLDYGKDTPAVSHPAFQAEDGKVYSANWPTDKTDAYDDAKKYAPTAEYIKRHIQGEWPGVLKPTAQANIDRQLASIMFQLEAIKIQIADYTNHDNNRDKESAGCPT